MAQIELWSQTGLYIFIGLLFVGGLVWLLLKSSKRVGDPSVDELDCATRTVRGTIIPSSSPDPTGFRAFIYKQDGTTGPGSEVSVPSADYTITNTTTQKKFELRNVAADVIPPAGPVLVRVIAEFSGDERTGTASFNCGSGSGNIELLARRSAPPADQCVATTVAHRYSVPEPGFAVAALQNFNRVWNLVYREGCCGGLMWDNGGDGVSAPRVELSTERLYGTPWQLTFRWREAVIRYTKPAEEWRALAENTFRAASASGVAAGVPLPVQLTVYPA